MNELKVVKLEEISFLRSKVDSLKKEKRIKEFDLNSLILKHNNAGLTSNQLGLMQKRIDEIEQIVINLRSYNCRLKQLYDIIFNK